MRRVRIGAVLASRSVDKSGHDLWVEVPRAVAPLLAQPGRFVFARPAHLDRAYGTPLTVVETSRRGMRLVFGIAGPKTSALASLTSGQRLAWTGPYRGGLLGLSRLRRSLSSGPGQAVVIARGMGQAVALPLVEAILAAPGWQVRLLLDDAATPRAPRAEAGKTEPGDRDGLPSAMKWRQYTNRDGCSIGQIACYTADGLAQLRRELAVPGEGRLVLATCGTDLLHRWAVGVWSELCKDGLRGSRLPLLVATNNSLMTCGEGTCGACTKRLSSGDRYRACKADCPPELLFAAPGNNTRGNNTR